MGVRTTSVQSTTLVNTSVGINAETVIVTTPPVSLPTDSAVVLLFWYMLHTLGATAVSTSYRLRRGTTVAATLINAGSSLTGLTAGNLILGSGSFFDTPGVIAGQQYSLTCIDPASTATGAVQEGSLMAVVL